MRWQWNSQLPGRSGVQSMLIVARGRRSSVTAIRRARGSIAAVRQAIALRVHPEVEPVQMHRVIAPGGVDPAPSEGVTHPGLDPLVVGKGPAVDGERPLDGAGIRRLAPGVDDEDLLVRTCPGRVDHQSAGKLLALQQGILASDDRIVEVGAGLPGWKPYPGRLARGYHQAVGRRGGTSGQAADGDGRVRKLVADGGVDDAAGGRPEEGPGNLRRVPRLPERGDGDGRSVRAVGGPGGHPHHQSDAKRIVLEPAGGTAVVVGLGHRQCGAVEPVRERQADDAGEQEPTHLRGQGVAFEEVPRNLHGGPPLGQGGCSAAPWVLVKGERWRRHALRALPGAPGCEVLR